MMKTEFNGAGGVGSSSVRRCQRLRQGGGKARKMAFDTSGSGGDGRKGGSSGGGGGGGGGDGGSGGGGRRR